ncbi:uncharacterized protein LOC135471502 [Liolophura sinensis]|uniref:uncharacterized protein LOC135471502 n=1 Tax=Liolophura sinensis TaxID=3198878 RepID=UPI0031597758
MNLVKLLTIVGGFIVGQLNGETVNLFTMCGRGTDGEAKLVSRSENVTVEIYGKDWPTGKNSCEVVFQSKTGRRSLNYKFKRFQVNDYVTEVNVHSKSSLIFIQRIFNKFLPPDIGVLEPGTSTIRIIVTRRNLAATSLIASMELSIRQVSSGMASVCRMPALVIVGVTLSALGLVFSNV